MIEFIISSLPLIGTVMTTMYLRRDFESLATYHCMVITSSSYTVSIQFQPEDIWWRIIMYSNNTWTQRGGSYTQFRVGEYRSVKVTLGALEAPQEETFRWQWALLEVATLEDDVLKFKHCCTGGVIDVLHSCNASGYIKLHRDVQFKFYKHIFLYSEFTKILHCQCPSLYCTTNSKETRSSILKLHSYVCM